MDPLYQFSICASCLQGEKGKSEQKIRVSMAEARNPGVLLLAHDEYDQHSFDPQCEPRTRAVFTGRQAALSRASPSSRSVCVV